MKKSILLIPVLILALVSCNKDDAAPALPPESAIINKDWKLSALTVSPAMNGITNIYQDFFEDCERDNLFRFLPSSEFQIDEGPSKCNSFDEQVIYGTWNYDSPSGKLTFSTGGDIYELYITEANQSQMKAYSKDDFGGTVYTTYWTFIKV